MSMCSKYLITLITAVFLSACASSKGLRETNALNTDGSRKTSEEMRVFEMNHAQNNDNILRDLNKINLAVLYASAFTTDKEKIQAGITNNPSIVSFVGNINMGIAVIDRSATLLGGASAFSGAFAGGLFLGGFLSGVNDGLKATALKNEYAITMGERNITFVRFVSSAASQEAKTRHNDIEQGFKEVSGIAENLGCLYSFDESLNSTAVIGMRHLRFHRCNGTKQSVRMLSTATDYALPNTIAYSLAIYNLTQPAILEYESLKTQIPDEYIAVFAATIDGNKKIVVANRNVVVAIDTPKAP